jgi:dihydropyrimidinase
MGHLATVATDHCPFWFERDKCRDRSDFTKIPSGAPGIENRMSLVFDGGVHGGLFGLNRFVAVTSTNAAKLFGLFPRKGTIAVGSDADVVVFDPEREVTISVADPQTHHMRVDYTPYEGFKVRGHPETVISRGKIVCHHGEFRGHPGAGRFLRRDPSGFVVC